MYDIRRKKSRCRNRFNEIPRLNEWAPLTHAPDLPQSGQIESEKVMREGGYWKCQCSLTVRSRIGDAR